MHIMKGIFNHTSWCGEGGATCKNYKYNLLKCLKQKKQNLDIPTFINL